MCVVQRTQQPAPQEPCDAEARLEDAEAGAAHGGRDDAADGGLHNALLRAHAHAPQHDADAHQHRPAGEEDKAGEERTAQGGQHQRPQSDLVKEPTEEQRGKGVHRHGCRVQQAQGGGGKSLRSGGVQRDEGEVRKAEGKQADGRHIQHEGLLRVELCRGVRLLFKHLRVGVFDLGQHHQRDGDQRRDTKDGEAEPIGREQVAGPLDGGDGKEDDRA